MSVDREALVARLAGLLEQRSQVQEQLTAVGTLLNELEEAERYIESYEAESADDPSPSSCMVRLADGQLMDVYELRRRIEADIEALDIDVTMASN